MGDDERKQDVGSKCLFITIKLKSLAASLFLLLVATINFHDSQRESKRCFPNVKTHFDVCNACTILYITPAGTEEKKRTRPNSDSIMTHDLLMMFSSVLSFPEVTGRIAVSIDYGYAVQGVQNSGTIVAHKTIGYFR